MGKVYDAYHEITPETTMQEVADMAHKLREQARAEAVNDGLRPGCGNFLYTAGERVGYQVTQMFPTE